MSWPQRVRPWFHVAGKYEEGLCIFYKHDLLHRAIKVTVLRTGLLKGLTWLMNKGRRKKKPAALVIGNLLPYSYFEGTADMEYELKIKRGDLVLSAAKVRAG